MTDVRERRSPADERAAVVAEALSWLGTPWAHAQRVKGAGVDCANLVIGVYAGAGLIEAFDPPPYPRDWHIHKTHEWFLSLMPGFPAREIAEADTGPGDLVLFKIGRVFSHVAIVADWPLGIHAAVNEGRVIACNLDRDVGLTSGPRKFFTHEGW
jgi:cell wall-associated NlpC family hydrolase